MTNHRKWRQHEYVANGGCEHITYVALDLVTTATRGVNQPLEEAATLGGMMHLADAGRMEYRRPAIVSHSMGQTERHLNSISFRPPGLPESRTPTYVDNFIVLAPATISRVVTASGVVDAKC